MEVKLVIGNGKQAGKEISLAGPTFLIGREKGCHLRPCSGDVSRKHCLIRVEKGEASIEDCGSTNGTFLNDQRINQRRELKDGDQLRVGLLALEVRFTVGVGGEKKPPVRSVQEAAARTVASAAADGDHLDIKGWIGDGSSLELASPREGPVAAGDTLAAKSIVDTVTMPIAPPARESEKKDVPGKAPMSAKAVGKHPAAKSVPGDSGAAADEALRRFFHRKKP